VEDGLTFLAFAAKTFFFILVFMLVRWTVPRFRYDQVMDLGWKLMLPAALVVVTVTAGTILALDAGRASRTGSCVRAGADRGERRSCSSPSSGSWTAAGS
jgi:hypothetical protein